MLCSGEAAHSSHVVFDTVSQSYVDAGHSLCAVLLEVEG